MSTEQPKKYAALPKSIVSPSDIERLSRELSSHDETLNQADLRQVPLDLKAKDISPDLHEFMRQSQKDILKAEDRKQCLAYLNSVASKAPLLHFSFADEPDEEAVGNLVEWLRSQIHPLALIAVGLAPGIGAGCYLRTTNRQFDFTLKTRLIASRDSLISKIREVSAGEQPK